MPVPDRVTVAGEPVALLATEMLPFTLPAEVGSKATETLRVCEGVSVTLEPPPLME